MAHEPELVATLEEAVANIHLYAAELQSNKPWQDAMSFARAWYAAPSSLGGWDIAPSKFISYANPRVAITSPESSMRDGRVTERVLSEWFGQPVDSRSVLGRELETRLRAMFARFGRRPNKLARISVPKDFTVDNAITAPALGPSIEDALARITADPDRCGGRPTIRGLRVRVSDILELLAAGVSRSEILADYAFLEDEDITAALVYAARWADHRILHAA